MEVMQIVSILGSLKEKRDTENEFQHTRFI